jgi:hypothetical protein
LGLLENRGCRWTSNSNSKQYCISKLNSCLHYIGECKQDFKEDLRFTSRRNSGSAVPTLGVVFFILSSFKFVPYLLLTSTRNTIST